MRSPLLSAALFGLAACTQPGTNAAPENGRGPSDGAEGALPAPAETAHGETSWDGYRAGGNEPFWNVTFNDGQMVFEHFDAPGATAPRPAPETTANGYRFAARADGQPFIVEIEHAYCADSMSGRPYPDSVKVTVHGDGFTGCGGDTASLVTGPPWQVTSVDDTSVAGSLGMTVRFAEDGSISGYTGCNRYTGSYEAGGEGISTGPIAATRRACLDPSANRMESEFLTALGGLRSFSIEDDGSLVLVAENGTEIRAQR
ncbi:MAG: META domain-containing protein [Parasphingopyxis sp.]|nr:META domain-containing protein [Sphingomonadales bacterium]